jgi:hypothetical protein
MLYAKNYSYNALMELNERTNKPSGLQTVIGMVIKLSYKRAVLTL